MIGALRLAAPRTLLAEVARLVDGHLHIDAIEACIIFDGHEVSVTAAYWVGEDVSGWSVYEWAEQLDKEVVA